VEELVRRLAGGVAPGGTLLLVGHRPVDPVTGAPTPAVGQVQISVEEAVAALHPPAGRSSSPKSGRDRRLGPASTPWCAQRAQRDHGRRTRTTQRPFPVVDLLCWTGRF
jgi:hypothetical protein